MEIVIDSVAVNHLLRSQRKVAGRFTTCLDQHLLTRSLKVKRDPKGALLDEWGETCGVENIRALIIHWDQYGGVTPVKGLGKISSHVAKSLRQLGFRDTIDKLVLRIAIATRDRIVVSEDSDFWDPHSNPRRKCLGDENAPVAKLCLEKLGVRAVTVLALMTIL